MKIVISHLFSILFFASSIFQVLGFSNAVENTNSGVSEDPHFRLDETENSHDPTDDPTPTLTDIANMVNERGFYKSNGFSFDEQESLTISMEISCTSYLCTIIR